MTNKMISTIENNNITIYYSFKDVDRTKIMGVGASNLRAIINEILVDTDRQNDKNLGEYYDTTLHYLIAAMPVQNYALLECADSLRGIEFKNFSVTKIFVRYDKKEIIAISDKMNDDVLEEFYGKTFELSYMKDSEIVFMITTEDAVDHAAMLNYDKLIEVDRHE